MENVPKLYSFMFHTKIMYGIDASKKIGEVAKGYGSKRALVVTDSGVVNAGLFSVVEQGLKDSGVEVDVFSEVEPNPKDIHVTRGAELFKKRHDDILVGLGGGSSMDSAKGIRIVSDFGGNIRDYEGFGKIPGSHKTPLITIPTTSGTGAEVTAWAVITDTARKWKMGMGGGEMAPSVALVDPLMTKSLPPELTASTGIDALSHAVGAYVSKAANPIADALALYAIELISNSLRRATAYGEDIDARLNMAVGSLTAGMAMELAPCDGVHSLAETIGGYYDAGHGVCIAGVMPYAMKHNLIAEEKKFARVAQAMGERVEDLPVRDAAARAVAALQKLITDLEIPTLKEIGLQKEDIPKIVQISRSNVCEPFNPRKVRHKDLENILLTAYEGKL